jgi:hypothetical protein
VELQERLIWWKRQRAQGIRRLLMEEWDPIGVKDIPEAADEYDSYVGPVGRMLREASEIAGYLTAISTNRKELGDTPQGREHDERVAETLVRRYAAETGSPE